MMHQVFYVGPKQHEILWAIIVLLVVAVVDDLSLVYMSAKDTLHY